MTTFAAAYGSNNAIAVGLEDKLSSILGPIQIDTTSELPGLNRVNLEDQDQTSPQIYTFYNATFTATSFPSSIKLELGTVNLGTQLYLQPAGGSTINLDGTAQFADQSLSFFGENLIGPSTLNVLADTPALTYGSDSFSFAPEGPGIQYQYLRTINVTKPATPPVGSSATITGKAGTAHE